MPRSQGQTLRFCGAEGGIGDQAGGGVGGGGGVGWLGWKAMVAWDDVSRACGYCTVAPGSDGGGAPALTRGEPSSRQKLRASSV